MLKNRTILKIIGTLLILLTSSCIGLSVVTETEKNIPYPRFRVKHERLKYDDIDLGRAFSSGASHNYQKTSKEDVLTLWGKPDRIIKGGNILKNGDGVEYWSYKRELGFSGIVIGAVIPIPLLVPTGYRDTILIFENDILQSIKVKRGGHSYGYFCALILCTENNTDIWNIEPF